jgi:hypothetical protein
LPLSTPKGIQHLLKALQPLYAKVKRHVAQRFLPGARQTPPPRKMPIKISRSIPGVIQQNMVGLFLCPFEALFNAWPGVTVTNSELSSGATVWRKAQALVAFQNLDKVMDIHCHFLIHFSGFFSNIFASA